MLDVRSLFLLGALVVVGCTPEAGREQKVTGSSVAVAGLPRQPSRGRVILKNCCTFRLAADVRIIQKQGIDSVIYKFSGRGYGIDVVFGPFESNDVPSGYLIEDKVIVDGVELTSLRWADPSRAPAEGRLLWLARVGGAKVGGVKHAPWGLRMTADCTTSTACNGSVALVRTIRF